MGELSASERPEVGKLANKIKKDLSKRFSEILKNLESTKDKKQAFLDVTLPGRNPIRGHFHPINEVRDEICRIFSTMGFRVVTGPNVELDYYNFEALNIPKDHPARDMQDTFYISDNVVLRTHTSPTQVRVMEKQKPLDIIYPVLEHGNSFNTYTESKAGVFIGIIIHESINLRINHSRAEDLEPAGI